MTAATEGDENQLIRHLLTRYLPLEDGIPDVLRNQRPWEVILRDQDPSETGSSVPEHEFFEGRKPAE